MEYIVRADFYPNGEIIPLGITDCHGNSIFVNRVIKVIKITENNIYFKCSASGNRELLLSFAEASGLLRWSDGYIY